MAEFPGLGGGLEEAGAGGDAGGLGGAADTPAEAAAGLANMRSLRYIDRMRRQKDGWRISDRIHTLDWSCQIPANFAIMLAQRVSALPPAGT